MATRQPPGDPRLLARLPGEEGVQPIVALPRQGPPGWMLAAVAALAAILLFVVLDARRREPASMPSVRPRGADALGTPLPPPPLYIPPEVVQPSFAPVLAPLPAPAPAPPPAPQIVYVPQPIPVPAPAPIEAPAPPQRVANDPALVVDTGAPPQVAAAGAAVPPAPAGGDDAASAAAALGAGAQVGRARAGVFANRTTTVPQGTLIPAVLETALDSTRPGFARAIVSRDVRGFDGSRVLIPRGSRLIGEYQSQAAPGQRRALVTWIRLIRPDGVTMAIGSPAGDPLGRGGIRARVNTHFFERFAGAILQSALDIGVNLASTAGHGQVIVALPGTIQGSVGQIVQPAQITPTLTVRQGTSISIFVARDLDFTGVEHRR
jgi:type IV secretion system protein VirB10